MADMKDWAIQAAEQGFETALLLSNLKTSKAEAAFRDIKRHIVGQVASLLREEIEKAVKNRDMEWWQAVILVDNVAPTPEAAKEWIARVTDHHVKEAVREERERCAKLADGWSILDTNDPSASLASLAKAIRSAQGEPAPRRHDDLVCMSHREVRLAVGIEPDEHGFYGVEECPKCIEEAGEPKGEEAGRG